MKWVTVRLLLCWSCCRDVVLECSIGYHHTMFSHWREGATLSISIFIYSVAMQYTSKLATVVCNVMGENLSFIFPKKCTKFNPKKIAFIRSSIWLRNKTSPFTTLPSRWKSNLNTRQFSTHAHVEYNSTVEAATIKTNTKNGSCGSHFPVMSFFHLGGHCQPGCYWRRGFIPPACHVILGVSRAPSAADTLSDILHNPWMWIWSEIHLMGTHSHARTPPRGQFL